MKQYPSLVGQCFHDWRVLKYAENNYWLCRCSCGTEKLVREQYLLEGRSTNCGCKRRSINNKYNLLGQQFGEWTVVDYIGNGKWLCRCSCGVEKIIRRYDLINNVTKSCGHDRRSKIYDYIGEQINDWYILDVVDCKTVFARCSCGVEKNVDINSIITQRSKSCGHDNSNKHIDISGKYFGDLYVDKYIQGTNKWKCICTCGVELLKSYYELTNYGYKCIHMRKRYSDIHLGDKFGDWTVVAKSQKDKHWVCRCSCGNTSDVSDYSLKSGNSKHCNSAIHKKYNQIDLTGKRFGKLVVNRYIGLGFWECVCDCGNVKNIMSVNLRNESTNSCGCIRYKIDEDTITKTIEEYLINNGSKPFIDELANILDVDCSTIRNCIERYSLQDRINKSYRSRYEREIASLFNSDDIIISDRKTINPYELDIYIPSRKLAIEFNGTYWHSEQYKDKYYHQKKTVDCAKKGIRLIHIFEHEWKDDRLHDILVKMIKNNPIRIGGRDTYVQEINRNVADDFLNTYHLQGSTNSEIRLGCFIKKTDELISVMTFGKPRFNTGYQYELIRFCTNNSYRVVGGSEKLFRYFLKNFKPTSIITYTDISKFTGNVYTRLGFKPIQPKPITEPNYVWVSLDNKNTLSRYQTQKHLLVEHGLGTEDQTEDEIMTSNGFVKLYNSGNLKLKWTKEENLTT